jgi:hypothetical protein
MVTFHVGDEVEFERGQSFVDGAADDYPRWSGVIDRGPTGKWLPGKVIGILASNQVEVEYIKPSTGELSFWIWTESTCYWGLRHRAKPPCECGGTKLNLPHSHWCPLYI